MLLFLFVVAVVVRSNMWATGEGDHLQCGILGLGRWVREQAGICSFGETSSEMQARKVQRGLLSAIGAEAC